MKKNILVSIIIPIYNKLDEDLQKCLNSVANQTYQNIEVLLVDDGSTASNAMLCDSYVKKDSRFQVFHQKNSGVSAARNVGIEKATGEYIMFLDADDWLELNCIELAHPLMGDKNDLIYFDYYKNYETGHEEVLVGNKENTIYKMPIIGSSCMKLYHKELLIKERFNEKLINGEDVEFNFRVFKNVKKYAYLRRCLYHYKIQLNSAVRGFHESMIERYQQTLDCIYNEINREDVTELKAFYSFCAISFIMICTNYFFNEKNQMKYAEKKSGIKTLLETSPYDEMCNNIDMVELPMSRKIVILLAQYHLYFGIDAISYIKNKKK